MMKAVVLLILLVVICAIKTQEINISQTELINTELINTELINTELINTELINTDRTNGKYKLKGIDFIGSGIDLIFGTPTGRNVIKYTYDDNNEFEDQMHGEIYTYPDQLTVNEEPSGIVTTDVFRQWQYKARSMTEKVKASTDLGWFSGSVETERVRKQISNTSKSVSEVTENVALYHMKTESPRFLEPSNRLMKYVSILMKEYNYDNCLELVDQIGTHWITEATFGGVAGMNTIVGESYTEHESNDKIKAQAGIEFSWVKAHGEYEKECHSLDKNYRFERHYVTSTRGGNPASLKNFEKWAASVYKSPIAVSYKVERLTTLIKDSKLRTNTDKCIIEYAKKHPIHKPVKKLKNCVIKRYITQKIPVNEGGGFRSFVVSTILGTYLHKLGVTSVGSKTCGKMKTMKIFKYNSSGFTIKGSKLGTIGKCYTNNRSPVCDNIYGPVKDPKLNVDLLKYIYPYMYGKVCCREVHE
jgi:hypothetical protein